jgi:endo-1,4-beta-xylanase
MSDPHRRTLLAGGGALASTLALAGCGRRAEASGADGYDPAPSAAPRSGPVPGLRDLAGFPIGTCISSGLIDDPDWSGLAVRQCSQVTAEWEMKMESILKDDGTFDFSRADRIADYARARGMRLFGHTLVWYAQNPPALQRIDGNRSAFDNAVRNYILAVVEHYRGQAVGWDVVNEAVAEHGEGLRDCIYSRNLGQEDYMLLAFQYAREADPDAVLLINDYDLEKTPAKRATFLKLVERLLKRGAPIGGIGTQSHFDIHLQPGAARTAMRELAGLGLPIHVSELDISLRGDRMDLRPRAQKLAAQAARYREVIGAFLELPAHQRFAFTTWGLRDKDSWLRRPPNAGDGTDAPLPFDDQGRPKPAFWALADALKG